MHRRLSQFVLATATVAVFAAYGFVSTNTAHQASAQSGIDACMQLGEYLDQTNSTQQGAHQTDDYRIYQCAVTASSREDARRFAAPTKALFQGGSFSTNPRWSRRRADRWKQQHCTDAERNRSTLTYLNQQRQSASPQVALLIDNCIAMVTNGTGSALRCALTRPNANTFTVRYTAPISDSPAQGVAGTHHFDGVSCTGVPATVNATARTISCRRQRPRGQPMSVSLNYSVGTCTIDFTQTCTDEWFRDSDGDGFGSPDDMRIACTRPPNYVDNSRDCDDENANVRPNQTGWFDRPAGRDVGFDYNCDGRETKRYRNRHRCRGGRHNCRAEPQGWRREAIPECGEEDKWVLDCRRCRRPIMGPRRRTERRRQQCR